MLNYKRRNSGNSLAVQWLGLGAFIAGAQVQSLVGELRSHKLRGVEREKEREREREGGREEGRNERRKENSVGYC